MNLTTHFSHPNNRMRRALFCLFSSQRSNRQLAHVPRFNVWYFWNISTANRPAAFLQSNPIHCKHVRPMCFSLLDWILDAVRCESCAAATKAGNNETNFILYSLLLLYSVCSVYCASFLWPFIRRPSISFWFDARTKSRKEKNYWFASVSVYNASAIARWEYAAIN